MDKLIGAIAEQAPSLAILAFITIQFLRHLAKRDDAMEKLSSRWSECVLECNRTLGRATDAIERFEARLTDDHK